MPLGRQWYVMVVIGPTGEQPPRDVEGDLDDPASFRDALLAVARQDTYRTGGQVESWIHEWEALVFDQDEHRKGSYHRGWGEPARRLQFTR